MQSLFTTKPPMTELPLHMPSRRRIGVKSCNMDRANHSPHHFWLSRDRHTMLACVTTGQFDASLQWQIIFFFKIFVYMRGAPTWVSVLWRSGYLPSLGAGAAGGGGATIWVWWTNPSPLQEQRKLLTAAPAWARIVVYHSKAESPQSKTAGNLYEYKNKQTNK